jgi:hypothetical protein
MTLVPLGIILWFKAHGALQPMLNGTIRFNMEPNTTQRPYRMFGMVPALLTLLWLDSRMKRWAPASPLTGRRRVLFLTVGVFLILELTVWPVDRWQDFLPVWPLLTILFVPAAEGMGSVQPAKRTGLRLAALPRFPLMAGLELAVLLLALPHSTALAHQVKTWHAVLRLTRAGDYVMDEKGELLFRRRAYYYELETITRARIAQHLLPDDIPQSLARTNTLVVGPDLRHFPRACIHPGQLHLGRSPPVAGQFSALRPARVPTQQIDHQLRDQDSCMVQHSDSSGSAQGSLDDVPLSGPRFLGVGRHTYQPGYENVRTALVLAKAIDLCFQPF